MGKTKRNTHQEEDPIEHEMQRYLRGFRDERRYCDDEIKPNQSGDGRIIRKEINDE
jgi:hypothetical protein